MVYRTDARGRLYLAGSLVKGKVREGFDAGAADPFTDSGGRSRSRAADMSPGPIRWGRRHKGPPPERYPAVFYDFIADGPWPRPGARTITHAASAAATGSAEPGGLWIIDCPVSAPDEIAFRGEVRFAAATFKEANDRHKDILGRMDRVHGYGAHQSTGSAGKCPCAFAGSGSGTSRRASRSIPSAPSGSRPWRCPGSPWSTGSCSTRSASPAA